MAEIRIDFQEKPDPQIQADRLAAYAQKLNEKTSKEDKDKDKDKE